MFITIKLTDGSIREYKNINDATRHSIEINLAEEIHPSFELHKLNGKRKAIYIGRLQRDFGETKLYWD